MRNYYFSIFVCIQVLIFSMGCTNSYTTSLLSLDSPGWCFFSYDDSITFNDYMAFHEANVKSVNDINSMQLLGCAYYQKGDIALAEKWLVSAYEAGQEEAPTALTAIYLKEGDLQKASLWHKQIADETDHVRWLKVVEQIKKYKKYDKEVYLSQAYTALNYKINYEGPTSMTSQLLEIMNYIIEQSPYCTEPVSVDCRVSDFNEKKNYIYVLAEGVLSVMVPSVPLAWNFENGESAPVPVAEAESQQKPETTAQLNEPAQEQPSGQQAEVQQPQPEGNAPEEETTV